MQDSTFVHVKGNQSLLVITNIKNRIRSGPFPTSIGNVFSPFWRFWIIFNHQARNQIYSAIDKLAIGDIHINVSECDQFNIPKFTGQITQEIKSIHFRRGVRMEGETAIEKTIKHFVLRRTGDDVYLDLSTPNCICVKHKTERGSVVLATMWCNVLQHIRYPYKKYYDANGFYRLVLVVDWHQSNCVHGKRYADDARQLCSTMKFESILISFSLPKKQPQPLTDYFCKNREEWNEIIFRQKAKKDMYPAEFEKAVEAEKTEEKNKEKAELYNVADDLAEENEIMNVEMLSDSALQHQLTKLQTGAVKDGPTYIYKIWKSLLNKWFSDGKYHVYIASPFLDSDRLDDICKLVLKNKLTASLDALYVRRQCDIDKDISAVKRTTQQRFAQQDRVFS
ncbi:hypothetical protein KUTeg_013459 [Tegillarca granosa]|uniref:DDE-1 domain-containing protein n=1 Tax=Tegillarca granosa TaxID=220873 RepID=A0ABQ9ETU4_TEGGR|nr:hypothetical protein KUTeg_013459 [Tegillarca granosa]